MPVERDDAALAQPVRPRGPARLAHHDAARVRPRRLGARLGDAVVADHRRGEADDLLRVARVGDDLLVAGHRGREDGLAEGDALGADRLARGRPCRPRARGSPAAQRHRVIAVVRRTRARPRPSAAPCRAASAPSSHEFAERERKPSSPTRQRRRRGRAGRGSRGAPTAIRGALEPEGPRRPGRHPLEQRLEREQPRLDEVRVERGERRLEAGDAERRLLERDVLLVRARAARGRSRSPRSCRRAAPRSAPRGRRRPGAAGSSSGSGRATRPPRR